MSISTGQVSAEGELARRPAWLNGYLPHVERHSSELFTVLGRCGGGAGALVFRLLLAMSNLLSALLWRRFAVFAVCPTSSMISP